MALGELWRDLSELTKLRLNALVLVSTGVGVCMGGGGWPGWALFLHTIVGAGMVALGSGAFNQLMEIEEDARMARTANRPLPARRLPPLGAFAVGWLLAAFGIMHLGVYVNIEAAALAAITLGLYVFVYTPMKRRSAWNTLVGAIAGALPPVIGWVAAAGGNETASQFRWGLLIDAGSVYLFLLLLLWQIPHFLAINWLCRDEYREAGFEMLANADASGKKSAGVSLAGALLLTILPVLAGWAWGMEAIGVVVGVAAGGVLVWLAKRFWDDANRSTARRLFFSTLLYLPILLIVSLFFWRG
jgi:heme o synthase